MTVALSFTYGIGGFDPEKPDGNLLEQIVLTDDDGTWKVRTCDGAGLVLSEREATGTEVAGATVPAAPEPAADDTASLRQQVADLKAQLDALTVALGG